MKSLAVARGRIVESLALVKKKRLRDLLGAFQSYVPGQYYFTI